MEAVLFRRNPPPFENDRKIDPGAIPVRRAEAPGEGVEHVPDCASWALCSCWLLPPRQTTAIRASR